MEILYFIVPIFGLLTALNFFSIYKNIKKETGNEIDSLIASISYGRKSHKYLINKLIELNCSNELIRKLRIKIRVFNCIAILLMITILIVFIRGILQGLH